MEDYIRLYYRLQPERKAVVLEKSDQDMELDEAFSAVDYTSTVIGRQYLYDRLKRPVLSETALIDLEREILLVSQKDSMRQYFEQQAKVLAAQDSADLPYLIFGGDLKTTWYYKWVPLLQVLMFLALVASIFSHWGLLVLIALFGFNLYLHFHNKMILDTYRRSLHTVKTLYDFCVSLNKHSGQEQILDEAVLEALSGLKPLRKRLSINQSLQLFTSSELYMLPWLVYELIKAFCLVEVKAAAFIVKAVNLKKPLIHLLYKAVGKVDFLQSILKLRAGGNTCTPSFVASVPDSDIRGLYHPLIEHCVRNDFSPGNNAVLITGSNAAGKSTFLRSLALSNHLATSIHTCFAEYFKLPLMTTLVAMHHQDNLEEGLSHYLSEVKDTTAIFKLSAQTPCLLLFDEPFNGTNSRERVAIAAAMLQYFGAHTQHMTLAATHDFELLQLLDGFYNMFYFNELVRQDGKLIFDYKLKQGKKQTRNALELIRIEGFPKAVVIRANQLYQDMEARVT